MPGFLRKPRRSNRPLRFLPLTAFLSLVLVSGCHSPYVETTVRNSGATEIQNIEVDYPSASFGIPSLAPGESFHYRFQIRNAGRMKVQFLDSAHKPHAGQGPYAAQGQQGTLTLTLDASGKNQWDANLHPSVPTPKGE